MIKEVLKSKIQNVLKDFEELFIEKELNDSKLISLVCPDGKSSNQELTDKIIEKLFEDEEIRRHFFTIKDKYCLFKSQDFKFFLEAGKTYNSYTKFKNQIGLAEGNKYLKHSEDVVLNFPFKDCILEGGQSNEDGTDYNIEFNKNGELKETNSKRKEIFFNEIVARDDIDVLLQPKAFTNFESHGDRKGGINHTKDNLLIKGNNLLALYSLLPIYNGKVKLIYIDPPYNTGNDGFKYNDNFNHSTWLTFMKNRLEVARELLSEDGVIFVQCDDNEQAYLKVLMDEVFGRENFITVISRIAKTASNKGKLFAPSCDYIIFFAKNINNLNENDFIDSVDETLYKKEDNKGKYRDDVALYQSSLDPMRGCSNQRYFIKAPDGSLLIPPGNHFPILKTDAEFCKPLDKNDKVWRWTYNTYIEKKDLLVFKETKTSPLLDENGNKAKYNIYTKSYLEERKETGTKRRNFLIDKEFLNRKGADHLKTIDVNFTFSKPEYLLMYLIDMTTQPNDLVLDFFAGSGTTGAVAHKMGRRWIMIEQMDYIENITKVRLQKVLEGEQGGVSKNHNWKGGGSFCYLELAKWNETAKEKILACNSLEELKTLFNELYEKYFLNYNLNVKLFFEGQNSQAIIDKDEFKALGLEKQKEIFCKMLDLNQMYVLASEVEDKIYELSKEDIELTKQFYSI